MIRKILIAGLMALSAAPAGAKWRVASSDHFLIYTEESEAELTEFAEKLERFDSAMRFVGMVEAWKPSPSNRLTIYVVPSISSVRKLFGDTSGNVAGFYLGRAGRSIAIVPRMSGSGSIYELGADTVLLHEYAHHFMYQNYVSPVPKWFSEGYAEFYSTMIAEKDGSVGVGRPALHRSYGLLSRNIISLPEMMSLRSGFKLSPGKGDSLYGRGWLLAHYLTFDTARRGQLSKYLQLLATGTPGLEAGTQAFGDLKTLDRELDRYIRRKSLNYLRISPEHLNAGAITVRALRPGEDAVMMSRIRSEIGVGPEVGARVLADMRRQAAPFPDDPFVQASLAEAEYDIGNYKEAEAAVDRALAADPRQADALIYKGRIKMALAANSSDPEVWKEVRRWFVQANRIDPEDPEPLIFYYRSFLEQGIRPTETAIDGLIYASDLAREESGLRMSVAREHLNRGNAKEARTLLATIAYRPHGGQMAEAATAIIAALDSGGAEAALRQWAQAPEGESEAEGE